MRGVMKGDKMTLAELQKRINDCQLDLTKAVIGVNKARKGVVPCTGFDIKMPKDDKDTNVYLVLM